MSHYDSELQVAYLAEPFLGDDVAGLSVYRRPREDEVPVGRLFHGAAALSGSPFAVTAA